MFEPGALLLTCALNPVPASVTAPEESLLVVQVSGFAHAGGQAIARLFQHGDNVLGRGRWQGSAFIHGGEAEIRFPGMQPGSYALVVFHDENNNGEIDHNVFGLPKESLGFSNGFSLGLFSGKPTFGKLRFAYTGSSQLIKVSVK